MFHVKHSEKKPAKTLADSGNRGDRREPIKIDPEQIAAEVRKRLAPVLPAIGVVAKSAAFLDRIERLAAMLALWGQKINLTANPTDPGEIVYHVFDSLMPLSMLVGSQALRLRPGFEPERRVLDIGSGAGFPGLVIAAAINAQVTLVEARRKRATFLGEAALEMGLRKVTVETARVETLKLERGFDLVTARAVGNPAELFKTAGRGLRPGGVLMLYVSSAQKFDEHAAEVAGLENRTIEGYELRLGDEVVSRAVATWIRR